MVIYDNCDISSSPLSNLGDGYEPPEGMIKGEERTKNYLAGKSTFKVTEIEVY